MAPGRPWRRTGGGQCCTPAGTAGVGESRRGRSQRSSRVPADCDPSFPTHYKVWSSQSMQASEATARRMRKCNPAGPTAQVWRDRVHQVRLQRMPGQASGAHYPRRVMACNSPRFPTLEWTKAWGQARPPLANGQDGLTGCEFTTMLCNARLDIPLRRAPVRDLIEPGAVIKHNVKVYAYGCSYAKSEWSLSRSMYQVASKV